MTSPVASPGPLFDPRRSSLKERQLTALEQAAKAASDALCEDLDSIGKTDDEICEATGVDRGHMSRFRNGTAHPPQKLVTYGIGNSRHRPPRYLVVTCAFAEHEPKPKPPPSVADVFHAYRDELAAMGLDDVLRERVERRLAVVLSPARHDGKEQGERR